LSTSLIDECYRRAREARRSAEMSSMPSQKTHFLDLEKRWLRAAESVAPNILRTDATTARPPITKVLKEADIEQPLRVNPAEDAAAPHCRDEIGDEQAGSANLALTMQYGGLEQTIPLRLPNHAIAMLALEAEVRETSLGQLLGTLIEAAMTRGLSEVLDDESPGAVRPRPVLDHSFVSLLSGSEHGAFPLLVLQHCPLGVRWPGVRR
jgi:hypothetical protein